MLNINIYINYNLPHKDTNKPNVPNEYLMGQNTKGIAIV